MRQSRSWAGLLAMAAFLVALPLADEAAAQRPKVAVMDFDYGTIDPWWSGTWDIGKGIADLIVDELVNDGTYAVIERKQLDTILAEQEFAMSDRAAPSASQLARIGEVSGVQAIITGSVTQFGFDDKSIGGGGGAFGGGRFGFGGAKVKKHKAKVQITARLIDASTGEILASVKAKGESSRSGVAVGGAGGGGIGALGGLEFGSDNFRETSLGEATEEAVRKVVEGLVKRVDRVQRAAAR